MDRRRWQLPVAIIALAVLAAYPGAAQQQDRRERERAVVAKPADPPVPPNLGSIQIDQLECVEPELGDNPNLRSAQGGDRPLRRAKVWPLRLTPDGTQLTFRPARRTPKPLVSGATSATTEVDTQAGDQLSPEPGSSCRSQAVFSFYQSGLVLPEMPAINFPEQPCDDRGRCVETTRAWIRAHYHLWIAQLMINFIAAQDHSEKRAWLWGRPGINEDGLPVTIKTSFEYWFGRYSDKRFHAVKDGLDELWDVMRWAKTGGINVKLRCPGHLDDNNVCNTKKPAAHHIVRGNVDLCAAFYQVQSDDGLVPRSRSDQARLVNHELLHHLWVDWGDVWVAVQDHHYHGHGAGCGESPDSSAQYGESKIRHLATYLNGFNKDCGHLARNVRNNDTFAYFITAVGSSVYDGKMTQWPHKAEPTPQPPQCVGDENCLCDDKETWPGSDPFEPDGDYSATQWCYDGDGEMTCRATKFGATTKGICKRCDDVRGPGCECDNGHPCDVGACYGDDTFNGGTGHCFKDPPPAWACLADCSRLLNDENAWCYADYPTGEARCMDNLCTEPTAFNCNLDGGKVCRYDECVVECADDSDCADKGYPPIFHCNQGRCEHGL